MNVASLSPPWVYSEAEEISEVVVDIKASKTEAFVLPLWYGSYEFPKADTSYPAETISKRAEVVRAKDLVILPNHVLVHSKTNELQSYTFMRNRKFHHGGVKLLEDGTYRPKYKIQKLPTVKYDFPVYHADTDHPEVYGHVLLEALSSLWATELVREKDVRIITSVKPTPGYRSMFRSLGISDERLIHLKGAAYTSEAYLPGKIIQRRRFIDPIARSVYDRMGGMLSWRSDLSPFERIYISRSKVSGRKLVNEQEVEGMFSDLGFAIIHPQELSIFDQVKLFSSAKFIAGSGGSAIHNVLFSRDDCKVLILSSIGWVVVADALICQVPGQLGYVFGAPPIMPPDTHRTQADWHIEMKEVRAAVKEHFGI